MKKLIVICLLLSSELRAQDMPMFKFILGADVATTNSSSNYGLLMGGAYHLNRNWSVGVQGLYFYLNTPLQIYMQDPQDNSFYRINSDYKSNQLVDIYHFTLSYRIMSIYKVSFDFTGGMGWIFQECSGIIGSATDSINVVSPSLLYKVNEHMKKQSGISMTLGAGFSVSYNFNRFVSFRGGYFHNNLALLNNPGGMAIQDAKVYSLNEELNDASFKRYSGNFPGCFLWFLEFNFGTRKYR